jgi:hypothetical protein
MLTSLALWATWARVRSAADGVLDQLGRIRVVFNGIVAVCLVAGLALTGWWIAASARANEQARQEAAQAAAIRALAEKVTPFLADRKAGQAIEQARLNALSEDIRGLVAAMLAAEPPARVETRVETVAVGVPVALPGTGRVIACEAPLPEAIRAKLNEININRGP